MNSSALASLLLGQGWIVSLPRHQSWVVVDCGVRRLRIVPTATPERYAVTGDPAPRTQVVLDLDGVVSLLRQAHRTPPRCPPGWRQLRPLPAQLTTACEVCAAPAVAILPSGGRCVNHPPLQGEWGWNVDWTDPAAVRVPAA